MRMTRAILTGLMSVLTSTAALADCVMRDATTAEVEHFRSVYAALRDALPPAPPNWKFELVTKDGTIPGVCKSQGTGEFEIFVSGNYKYQPPKDERVRLETEERKVESEIRALRQLPPDLAAEQQGWREKKDAAYLASRAAAKDGNKALATQKGAEGNGYGAKQDAVAFRYYDSIKPQMTQLEDKRRALHYDWWEVSVRLMANERFPHAPSATLESEIVVGNPALPKAPGLKVHNVRALFKGPALKREEIQAAIDKDKLARIVQ